MADVRSRITIRAVADAAGVSPTTVDRVLNGRAKVHPRTVAHVLETVEALRRQPDGRGGPPRALDHPIRALLPAGPNPFHDALAEAMTAQLEGLPPGIGHQVERIGLFDIRALVDALERAAERASAVAFVPIDHPAVREAAQALLDRGIPILPLLSFLSMREALPYVGQDNRSAGRTAGMLMGHMLGAREGTVGVIAGNVGFRAHEEREMGFRAVLREEFGHLRLTPTRESHDDPAEARAIVERFLAEVPDLVGLYNLGGSTTEVDRALAGAGRRVLAIQHDLTPATRAGLLEGRTTLLVHQDPRRVAEGAVEVLRQLVAGTPTIPPRRYMPIEVLTKENLP